MKINVKHLVMLAAFSLALNQARLQELKTGQQMPDLVLNNTINYTTDKLRLSDFKGELIIFDFWGPRCYSCIKAFPEINYLQKKFAGKVQIIMVNKDSKERTESFFRNRQQIKMPATPFVTSDSVLSGFFDHPTIPYNVWIDGEGTIRHVSENYYLTQKNIQLMLMGNDLKIPESKRYAEWGTLFDKSIESSVRYYSYISKCINENALKLQGPSKKESSITSYDCLSIVELYQSAYGLDMERAYFKRPGRTILLVKDSSKYIRPEEWDQLQNWFENNSYYYQLNLPDSRKREKYEIMQEDLNRFFGLRARIEKRNISCLTLISTGPLVKFKTKGGALSDNFFPVTISYSDSIITPIRYYNNKPYSNFSERLSLLIENKLRYPFYDEVKYKGNIDINMKGETLDNLSVQRLRNELKKYNLDLIEKEQIADILIIQENK